MVFYYAVFYSGLQENSDDVIGPVDAHRGVSALSNGQ
jgi:hypothetical protein